MTFANRPRPLALMACNLSQFSAAGALIIAEIPLFGEVNTFCPWCHGCADLVFNVPDTEEHLDKGNSFSDYRSPRGYSTFEPSIAQRIPTTPGRAPTKQDPTCENNLLRKTVAERDP